MTWATPEGDRVLGGSEAELAREVLAHMVDQISVDIEYGEGSPLFECPVEGFGCLTPTQQLAVITEVAKHLLCPTADTLDLTSINEAAVYAVFRTLALEIESEIELEGEPDCEDITPEEVVSWRTITLAAYRECFRFAGELDDESDWVPDSPQSRNLEQWQSMTERLADRILWDRDFEMAGSFLDNPPEKAAVFKQSLGIDVDYFSDAAPDLRPQYVERTLSEVRDITHKKPR